MPESRTWNSICWKASGVTRIDACRCLAAAAAAAVGTDDDDDEEEKN
jgi:hypothetical protein